MLELRQLDWWSAAGCGMVMLISTVLAAFVGAHFWVPRDVEAWNQYEEQFERDVASGVSWTEEEFNARFAQTAKPPIEPPPIGETQLLMNSLLFRPWVVLPFILASLLILRPRTKECILAAGGVALLLLSIAQMKATLFFALAVVLYFVGRRLIPPWTRRR